MNWDQIFSPQNLLVMGGSLIAGYAIFIVLMVMLPRKLRREHADQRDQVLQLAQKRREQILSEARRSFEQNLTLAREEVEEQINDRTQDLTVSEEELASQEESIQQTESRLSREEKDVENHKSKVDTLRQRYEEEKNRVDDSLKQVQHRLEVIANVNAKDIEQKLVDNHVTDRQLESQKQLKELIDDVETHSKKSADRMLSRLMSRYAPEFVWPKSTSHVDVIDPKIIEMLQSDKYTLLSDLKTLTQDVEVELTQENENNAPIVKLGGGYGIYKEAARLTLEEILTKGPNQWARVSQVYEKHRQALERTALKMGRQAVRELKIESMHDEILKMVGALNWRTSYRQNQYYHSLEVAKLAGILANELGVNPEEAKRCGLLHDIGKSIDYRIEGSHAVISGDYADRFGERRIICDTVMSHHNDLVLETPLAYVLKTADTLSGARPGARVNLEEGYQIRLSAIDQAVRSFPGIMKVAIMSGGREVHIEVHHKKIREEEIEGLTKAIARKIEEDVAFPGQIKVLVTRRFEATAVA